MSQVAIVGAGIVGLACGWALRRRGFSVTLIDTDFEGDRTSHGNAGAIAVGEVLPLSLRGLGLRPLRWLTDPLGPLSIRPAHALRLRPWYRALRRVSTLEAERQGAGALAAINGRALEAFSRLMNDIGLGHALHRAGALTVYGSLAAFERDLPGWMLKRELGIGWELMRQPGLQELEPALSPEVAVGVLEDEGAYVDDPMTVVAGLLAHLQAAGARCIRGRVTALGTNTADERIVELANGTRLRTDRVLVSAGAWSGELARTVGDPVIVESERGYNTTLPANRGLLSREVTFGEHHFVVTPLAPGLRIGGAAEFAGLEARPHYRRSDALLVLARRYLRGIDSRGCTRWMGQRPSMPDSLPVIGPSPSDPRVLYAFGHGHLGLTQSAVTGELIAALAAGVTPELDPLAYSIARFAAGGIGQRQRGR